MIPNFGNDDSFGIGGIQYRARVGGRRTPDMTHAIGLSS